MSGALCIRFELFGQGSHVMAKWRPLLSTEHGVLCAQANLDPVRFYFDVPESFHRVGHGTARIDGRKIDGYIMQRGQERPAGKVTLAYESERFRDDDPRSRQDFERLG